jgi:hypothetical protein
MCINRWYDVVKADVDPPVCKVVDYEAAEKARIAKEREALRAAKTKQRELREVHIGVSDRLYVTAVSSSPKPLFVFITCLHMLVYVFMCG